MDALLSFHINLSFSIILLLYMIFGISGIMSGLSGFGFSAVGAMSLCLLPPTLGIPLLMCLSACNQLLSIGQLKNDILPLNQWWPFGPTPFILGGILGIPIGLLILQTFPTAFLMIIFGMFLTLYSIYSLFAIKIHYHLKGCRNWIISIFIGFIGGIIGGFTAFPGAAVVVWTGLLNLPKKEARAITQPYIIILQIISLVLLILSHSEIFDINFRSIFVITLPIVLPFTLMGVKLYRKLSDINFRRISYMLLGISGISIFIKGLINLL